LMNAFAAVASVVLGLVGFREMLGTTPLAVAVHITAILLVLACVRPLTRAQERLIHGQAPAAVAVPSALRSWRPANPFAAAGRAVARAPAAGPAAARTLRSAGAGLIVVIVVIVAATANVGLLYQLRQLRWLALGPRVPDSLPLLQLAGFAGQPLVRVLVASLISGLVLAAVLVRVPIARRTPAIALIAAALLLIASDACYALAQDLRFSHVLVTRAPGLGPWVQFIALAVGSALPAAVGRAVLSRSRFRAVPRSLRRRAGAGAGTTEVYT